MLPGLLDIFDDDASGEAVIKWMDDSCFDDLIEIDIENDRCKNLYHVMGKYYVPTLDGSYEEIYDYAINHMIHPDDRDVYRDLMDPKTMLAGLEASETPGCRFAKLRYKMRNGSWRWVGKYLFSGEKYGMHEGIVHTYMYDIQNQVDRQQGGTNDEYYSNHDTRDDRTRLKREDGFFDELSQLMKAHKVDGWCLIAIDLEHFRLFNDWYGRDHGDLLLAKTGDLLAKAEEEFGSIAGYFGQDDFFVAMPYNQQHISHLYKGISALFAELRTEVGFRPMFGVCMIEEGVTILDLIDRAKLALVNARRDRKVGICLFESKMQQATNKEYEILLDFKKGMDNHEFKAYLQPQCRISSSKVVGAEALARWCKPDGTVVSPADFIPVLENHGFITDLDCYIWEEVCVLLRSWLDEGYEVVPVSVNVSQADLYAMDVPEFLDSLTQKYDIPKYLLKVEITESTFADSMSSIAETTQRLRDMGFVVLMDDFGSGYSSLNMLSSLNVDVIKLDAGFFRMSEEDIRKGTRIVESIVSMAKNLSLPIITEGVETKEQVDFLESLGCRFIQGFYYYRPMPSEDFESLIFEGQKVDDRGFSCKGNEQVGVREFFDQSLYNDAMLNNILGAVAFCLWHDGQLDIVRYNEQMYEEIGAPDFDDLTIGINKFVAPSDKERLPELFERATADLLNGASDTVAFLRRNGKISRYDLRLYYLRDKAPGKLFYASVKDVTAVYEARLKSAILAEYYPYSIVLNRQHSDGWQFLVAINGLGGILGFSQEEIQEEFDDGRFLLRLKPGVFDQALEIALAAVEEKEGFEFDFEARGNDGEFVPLHIRADYVENGLENVTHIMTISL